MRQLSSSKGLTVTTPQPPSYAVVSGSVVPRHLRSGVEGGVVGKVITGVNVVIWMDRQRYEGEEDVAGGGVRESRSEQRWWWGRWWLRMEGAWGSGGCDCWWRRWWWKRLSEEKKEKDRNGKKGVEILNYPSSSHQNNCFAHAVVFVSGNMCLLIISHNRLIYRFWIGTFFASCGRTYALALCSPPFISHI